MQEQWRNVHKIVIGRHVFQLSSYKERKKQTNNQTIKQYPPNQTKEKWDSPWFQTWEVAEDVWQGGGEGGGGFYGSMASQGMVEGGEMS